MIMLSEMAQTQIDIFFSYEDASFEPLDICVSTRTAIDPRKLVRSNGRGNQTLTFMEKIYFEAISKYLFIPIM